MIDKGADAAIVRVLNPSLDGEIRAVYGGGGVWLAGNPKTCSELSNLEHFWIGNSEDCACGEMVWHGSMPRPQAFIDAAPSSCSGWEIGE